MVQELFINLSLVLVTALVVAFIMRLLKQPQIIGYIITGIIISPFFLEAISKNQVIEVFSQIGVVFLMFIVGLHLNPKSIKEAGFTSLIVGIIQMVIIALIGFFLAYALGFKFLTSLYIAGALTFSSTIIVLKLLADKGDLEDMYGKISIGILILQDLAVIFILMLISTASNLNNLISPYSIFYGILAICFLFFASIYILPGITKFIAKNQELLFLFSVGWCFLLASLFHYLGFSMEIGSLLAGISLSMSPYNSEISSRVKPLRDFFIILFFIVLGSSIQLISNGSIQLSTFSQLIFPALVLSLFVFIFKFLIIMISMGMLGYKKRSGFLTGISLGQISEFSLILIALGASFNHFSQESIAILPLITLVFIITTISSTYLINYSRSIYPYFAGYLSIFERKNNLREDTVYKKQYDAILFGYNRIGFSLLKSLDSIDKKYLVVDFNPDTVRKLVSRRINCIYGDAEDVEFLKDINLDKAKMILSTIPDKEINLLIINKIREKNKDSIVIVISNQIDDAFKLYNAGADYVLTPHFLGGQYASSMIKEFKFDKKKYKLEKQKHIFSLKERILEGHEHPKPEKDR